MAADPKKIITRWEQLASARVVFESTWQAISDDLLGRRDFLTKRTPGERRDTRLYDGIGMQSADTFASSLQGLMVDPSSRWFDLRAQDDDLNEQDDVKRWLEHVAQRMFDVFSIPRSGHALAVTEMLLDLGAFGSGAMFVGDVPGKGVIFQARALSELFVAEGADARVDTIFRKYSMTARQAVQEFGDDAGPKVKKAVADGRPEEMFEFVHALYPRDEYSQGKVDGRNRPIASCYVSLADKEIVSEGGFYDMPILFGRWTKDAGEVYGRGPGWNALADMKMLNAMSKTIIAAAQKIVDPPLLVADDGVVLPVRTVPGGLNFGRMDARGDFIKPLQTGGRLDIGLEMQEQRRQAIRSAFYSQILETMRDPRMTAAQVYALQDEMMRVLGPMLGRLQSEMLGPMIDRTFAIMYRQGAFDEPPEALLDAPDLRVEYVSPMARAQKGRKATAIIRTYEPVLQLAASDPSVMDNFDNDEAARELVDANGAPLKILRPKEQVEAMRQARQQAQAQQAEMAAVQQMAAAAKDGAGAVQSVAGALTPPASPQAAA